MLSAVEGKGRVYLKTIFLTYSELSCKKKEAQEQMTDVDIKVPIYTHHIFRVLQHGPWVVNM